MKRLRMKWIAPGIAFVALVVYSTTNPSIGTATPAEIRALIPAEMLAVPRQDLAARARLSRLMNLTMEPARTLPDRILRILDEGPVQVSESDLGHREQRVLWCSSVANALRETVKKSVVEGDQETSLRSALAAIRVLRSFSRAGIQPIEIFVLNEGMYEVAVIAANGPWKRTSAHVAELQSTLATFSEREDLARSAAAEFRAITLPHLVQASSGREGLTLLVDSLTGSHVPLFGSYDPIESTRLAVKFALARQRGARKTVAAVNPALPVEARRLIDELPSDPPQGAPVWATVAVRWKARQVHNPIGRALFVPSDLDDLDQIAHRGMIFRRGLIGTLSALR